MLRWKGEPVTTLRQWTDLRRSAIGIVFQDFNLFPTLTAAENVEVAMFGTGITGAERRCRVAETLDAVGLSGRATHLPHELSGGERQRVAIARSIINGPKLLLADEPTGNLDSENSVAVLGLLRDLNERLGQTIVMITHNPEAAGYAHRTARMKDGVVLEAGV